MKQVRGQVTGQETGELGKTGEVTAELCEGGAAAGIGDVVKRRSKRKNVVNAAVGGKAGRLETKPSAADSSDSEGCVSDCSDLSLSQVAASQDQKYSSQMIKTFLQLTKGIKGLNIEQHFPDKLAFYHSARYVIKNRASSDLTDQEIHRLNKRVTNVRKELRF